MNGEEAFEIAATVAAISGLAALLILALVAITAIWRLFRHASDAAIGSTRALLSIEELARTLRNHHELAEPRTEHDQFGEVRQQAEALIQQQGRLQEMARNLLDQSALEGGVAPAALDDLETAVTRLDTTVGQMAASLANLMQLLERRAQDG